MTRKFQAEIEKIKGKRIQLGDLRRCWNAVYPDLAHQPNRAELLLDVLEALRREGVIEFPKQPSSFDRLVNPPLPKFVRRVRQDEKPPQEDWTRVSWQPELGFWTELKPQELAWAKKLNDWLCRRRGKFLSVPLRERSLEIFGDEKFLDSRVRNGALFSGRLSLAAIGAFFVAPPLAYRTSGTPALPILLVENHHTYWSLANWNTHTHRYSAVAYGVGNAVTSQSSSKSNAVEQAVYECQASGVLYFGDLDPEGVEIPLRLNANSSIKVEPAVDLYRFVLEHGTRRSGVKRKDSDTKSAKQWLPQLSDALCAMWDEDCWIPQESLGMEQLFDAHGEPRQSPTQPA